MKAEHLPKANFITAIVLAIGSLYIIVASYRMPRFQELGANPYSAPGLVPGFLGGVLLILSLILLIRAISRKGYALGINQMSMRAFFTNSATVRVLATIGLSVIYGLGLLGRVPYVPATVLYVLVFILMFEYRREQPVKAQWKTGVFAILQALLTAGCVAAVFRYLFLVNLP